MDKPKTIKLALITPDGEIVIIVEDISKYDLSKPLARSEIVYTIDTALAALFLS